MHLRVLLHQFAQRQLSQGGAYVQRHLPPPPWRKRRGKSGYIFSIATQLVNALDCIAEVPVWSSASSVSSISFYSFGTHNDISLKSIKGSVATVVSAQVHSSSLSAIPQLEQLLPFYQAPYDPTRATSMKTSLKNRFRILSNHFVIILGRPVT